MNVGNILANSVFRMISGYFPRMNQSIKEFSPVSSKIGVRFSGYKKLEKLYDFIEIAQRQGGKYSLGLSLESLSERNAQVMAFLDGGIPELKSLFLSLKEAKNMPSFELVDLEGVLEVKFN